MINTVLNTLFPERCPVCSNRSRKHAIAPICADCWSTIKPFTGPMCGRCGRPLVSEAATVCGECITDEPAFEQARSYGLYDGVQRKAINHLKYFGMRRLAKPLAETMRCMETPHVDAVMPVPLHTSRHRQREFNQSALIARYVAGYLDTALLIGTLVKIRETAPQVGLRYRERTKNVRNAFMVNDRICIAGRRILLIDDVVTTGSTIRECAKVLKEAGASHVFVHSLAHGVSD